MNRYFKIVEVAEYAKVKYYAVLFDGSELSEFEQFMAAFREGAYNDDLENILLWLKKIGNEIGAKIESSSSSNFFRHEGLGSDTKALPPTFVGNNLRLYCLVLNESVVVLINGGGPKQAQRVQDCPNLSTIFREANRISKAINIAFNEGEIAWNADFTDIIIEDQLEIEL